MIASIYKDIADNLMDKLNTNYTGDFKKLQHVDLFNNQISNYEKELPFDLPAIFVQIQMNNLRTKAGQWYQNGDLRLTLHVLQYSLDDTIKTTDILKYLEEVNIAVHGTTGTNYNHLIRTDVDLNNNTNMMYDHQLVYVANCWDGSANRDKGMSQVLIPDVGISK